MEITMMRNVKTTARTIFRKAILWKATSAYRAGNLMLTKKTKNCAVKVAYRNPVIFFLKKMLLKKNDVSATEMPSLIFFVD